VISSYFFRLLCLSLAAFFLVHLALGLVVSSLAPAAIRIARRLGPRRAVRFLLALRLFPLGIAMFAAAGLCVPSYLQFEPKATAEHIGFVCLAAAILGAAVWGVSIARALRAAAGSLRYTRHCRRIGRRTWLPGESSPVWVVERCAAPLLALIGVVRPRLVVSKNVLSGLSSRQLAAALRHEHAHWVSRDNLKRLLMLLAPDVFPFVRAFRAIERSWAMFAEWAADDSAVAGDSRHSLSLAAALVRVARMGAAAQPPLASSLLAGDRDLAERVERLLHAAPGKCGRHRHALTISASLTLAASLLVVILQPATLRGVHLLLEHLID
jgi:beta-lactamase regulating signal transducer with metallopeptidase domain